MYQADLTLTFTASHSLDTLRPEPHSHKWVVRVTLAIDDEALQEPGIIVNYFELKPLVQAMLPEGKHLNDAYPFAPTAENLAKAFYEQLKPQLPMLASVAVGEFEQFMCTYSEQAKP